MVGGFQDHRYITSEESWGNMLKMAIPCTLTIFTTKALFISHSEYMYNVCTVYTGFFLVHVLTDSHVTFNTRRADYCVITQVLVPSLIYNVNACLLFLTYRSTNVLAGCMYVHYNMEQGNFLPISWQYRRLALYFYFKKMRDYPKLLLNILKREGCILHVVC